MRTNGKSRPTALLPELLDTLGTTPQHMVWMVPTEAFQREHCARRGWRHETLRECSHMQLAWENWMRRDAGFVRAVAAQAENRHLPVIVVDGQQRLEDTVRTVESHY